MCGIFFFASIPPNVTVSWIFLYNKHNFQLFSSHLSNQMNCSMVKTRIKEHMFWGFRLILFLYCIIGGFLQNQPENVLKVFLKLFLKIKYCIDYQQMKSMCKHNILIN